jgi:hypothetical protein
VKDSEILDVIEGIFNETSETNTKNLMKGSKLEASFVFRSHSFL